MAASTPAGSSAPVASSAATSVSICSAADGADSRQGEKSQAKSSKNPGRSREEGPKGSFAAKGLPVPVSAVRFSAVGGPLALSLAGEPSLAGDFSLTGKPSLAGGLSLGSWRGCSAPTQINKQISAKTSTHARLAAESKSYTYAGGCFGEKSPSPARLSRARHLLSQWARPR